MTPPLEPGLVHPEEERARSAFNQIATGSWLAYHRGRISRAEYERGILAARGAYQLVLAHPELAPAPPRHVHGEALRDELVEQVIRILQDGPAAGRGQRGRGGPGQYPA
jgi:hypothetical protein